MPTSTGSVRSGTDSSPDVPDFLAASGVGQRFGDFVALDQVSLGFPRGAITGIVGPNGAGKSTLLDLLGGQQPLLQGRVRLDGTDVTALPAHQRARLGLTRTFQISRELGALTVLENLLLARPGQSGEQLLRVWFRPAQVRREEAAGVEQARSLLERVGLWRLADARADSLSGGQKKLLELCRALMTQPRMVLLDEPAAGVNPVLVGELCEFILALKAEGVTFGIVEHNMDMIAALCDSIYVLAEGRVLLHGSFQDILSNERVAQAYLGATA